MSIATLIIGESGTGKSTSMRNLDPEQTLLIQAVKKPLPFRSKGWKPVVKGEGGSVFATDESSKIVAAMERTEKEIIVVDDFQYVLANEFMRRVTDNETGNSAFAKYNEIARHAWDVLMKATSLPDHKRVYILSHTSTDEFGKTKIKTIGKLLDEKIVLEGLVTIVLRTMKVNDQYLFSTQNSGSDTAKSPIGLFESEHIPNDLQAVDKSICEYYEITQPA
ncbi:MAG TPA: AAA family ATPase [Dongiaceae bacterium]|nr:AAA family ATPase [Dongiaceae bacterium]